MTEGDIRHAILDLTTEDYMPLWVLVRSIDPLHEQSTQAVLRRMLRDGALGMFRGDRFIGEENPITDPIEIDAALDDPNNWQPSSPPRVVVAATEDGAREYYGS